jgi:peptidyl-prolyl cis-trans isomerase NIMA-interacting 1
LAGFFASHDLILELRITIIKTPEKLVGMHQLCMRGSATTTTATTTITEDVSMMKRDADEESGLKTSGATSKRQKTASSSSSSSSPKEVRVLHILKKHKDSRRPSSWRIPNITATKEEATAELSELLEVIQESPTGDEMRATFEELARTESDCTSAKRGGDLGFFGRRKMQPPFEDASFALQIGELSGIVESSSGVHLILRIG